MSDQRPVIRRAGAGDAPAIGRLLHAFNTEYDCPSPDPQQIAARVTELLAGGDTVVQLTGASAEEPEGIALLRLRPSLWSQALESQLAELYVIPARRGRGLGRALLEAAMEAARSEGADRVEFNTSVDDIAARALYERLGFTNHENGPDGPSMLYYERDL